MMKMGQIVRKRLKTTNIRKNGVDFSGNNGLLAINFVRKRANKTQNMARFDVQAVVTGDQAVRVDFRSAFEARGMKSVLTNARALNPATRDRLRAEMAGIHSQEDDTEKYKPRAKQKC